MAAPIGIIDSGVGGLTVVREVLKRLPNEPVIYIGDAARCPYGPRPAEEVKKFTTEMASALADMNIKMLVIACNTATAVALEELDERFDFPVIGVIAPGARAAIKSSTGKKVAVLGTVGTIKSGAYTRAMKELDPTVEVLPLACPDFVPLVENGLYKTEKARYAVAKTLEPLLSKQFDTTILGCTHYPLLEEHIENVLPDDVAIISSAIETVVDVERILSNTGMLSCEECRTSPIFYTTGEIDGFRTIIRDWLEIKNPDVRNIKLS